jgi:hypothetical protein
VIPFPNSNRKEEAIMQSVRRSIAARWQSGRGGKLLVGCSSLL